MKTSDAIQDLQQRVHHLENSHGLAGVNEPILRCGAAAAVDAKLERLAEDGYNPLEERVHELKERLDAFERSAHHSSPFLRPDRAQDIPVANSSTTPPRDETPRQRDTFFSLATSLLQHLQAGSAFPSANLAFSTHDLAEALLDRLKSGDTLTQTVSDRLEAVLLGRITKQNTEGRRRGRPSKQTDEGRKDSIGSNLSSGEAAVLSDLQPGKRGRGRPPKGSLDSRKGSLLSDVSTSAPSHASSVVGTNDADTELLPRPPKAKRGRPLKKRPEPNVAGGESASETLPNGQEGSLAADDKVIETPENRDEDVEMEEDEAEHSANIPPERRSARTPKKTKHFGDVVTWKEANKKMKGGRTTPYSPRVIK